MNAWAFGSFVLGPALWLLIAKTCAMLDRAWTRRDEATWPQHPKYHRPPIRGPVRDAVSRPLHTIDK
jgi:hypothetical protein